MMLEYAMKKCLAAIPTMLLVATLVFLAMRIIPGDPAIAALGADASERSLELFRRGMGLDRPLWEQYWLFISGLFRGDLGRSLVTNLPIMATVKYILPLSLELTAAGLVIGVSLGLPLGIWAAVRRNTWVDYLNRIVSLTGLSIPAFVLAILLLLVFSVQLGWFPVAGTGDVASFGDRMYRLFLPAMNVGLIMAAYVTRMTRATVLEVLSEDFVRTARSKGLSQNKVVYKHVLRNALIPIITIVGLNVSMLVGQSILTEIVFTRPGLGSFMVNAIYQRDYNTLQALVLIFTFLVVVINVITDLLYGMADPRIRYN